MRGDGCFVYKNLLNDAKAILALWTETESGGNFPRIINKTVCGVIAQLHPFRCYTAKIKECIGFVFPVAEVVVVLVSVQWLNLDMVVGLRMLRKRQILIEMKEALQLMESNL